MLRLPKSARLLKPSEFDRVFRERTSTSDGLIILYGALGASEQPRLGLTVSRKCGNAVVRNRWKRSLREAFRLVQHQLPHLRETASPNGGPAGDILIKINTAPHPHFRRQGKRLDIRVPITLAEALEGAKIDLPTPYGTITLTVPPGSSSGGKLRVKGQGVKVANGTAGDLFAELQIVLPSTFDEEDREKLQVILKKYSENPRTDLRW